MRFAVGWVTVALVLAGCEASGATTANVTAHVTTAPAAVSPEPLPTANDCAEFLALPTADRWQVARGQNSGETVISTVRLQLLTYCEANPEVRLADALQAASDAVEEAAATARAAAEAAARLNWSGGTSSATTADGYEYEFTVTGKVLAGSSSDTLNASPGSAEWTGPNIEATVAIRNLTTGHNALFSTATVVALWKTTTDDCVAYGRIYFGPEDAVLCPLAAAHPGVGPIHLADPEYVTTLLGPGETVTATGDVLSQTGASYPIEIPEDRALRLNAITANPPDAWYAVPEDIYTTTPNQAVVVTEFYGPSSELYNLIASEGLPACASEAECDALIQQWGLE